MDSFVGKRFGKQVVLRELGNGQAEIRCDCGTVKITRKQYLKNGQSKSCGCGRYDQRPGTQKILVGDVFNYLTVEADLGSNGRKRELLVCCVCGTRKVIVEADLRNGTTKSCGCFRSARAAKLNGSHGEAGRNRTVLYRAWESMLRRTKNPERYPSYAGRGITVCDEWTKFESFRDYVNENLGPRPDGMSLDRIDNDKGYQPGNIRWAPSEVQMRNRSSNTFFVIEGERLCLKDWSRRFAISPSAILSRLRMKWSPEDAILTPLGAPKGSRHP